jgi:nucleoside-diphosphate-sugar epimerase
MRLVFSNCGENEMSKVMVTGAAGFIGSCLVQRLADEGHSVVAVVRRPNQAAALAGKRIEPCLADVRDAAAIRKALHNVETVYHLAGRILATSLDNFRAVNVNGARNIAEACAASADRPTLVVVSSLAAAGPSRPGLPRTEVEPPAPVSNYGRSKLEGEHAASEWAEKVPISIVRPPFVFGGGDRTSLMLFRSVQRWGLHFLPCGHDLELSLIHVEDLLRALIAIAERGQRIGKPLCAGDKCCTHDRRAGIYNPADPSIVTYSDLGRMIGECRGKKVRVCRVARSLMRSVCAANAALSCVTGRPGILNFDKLREATAPAWTCSNERSRAQLGFSPAAPLALRLDQTIAWYQEAEWV